MGLANLGSLLHVAQQRWRPSEPRMAASPDLLPSNPLPLQRLLCRSHVTETWTVMRRSAALRSLATWFARARKRLDCTRGQRRSLPSCRCAPELRHTNQSAISSVAAAEAQCRRINQKKGPWD